VSTQDVQADLKGLFRRWRGKYIAVAGDVDGPGTIYYRWQAYGSRECVCLDTKDLDEALEKRARLMETHVHASDRAGYLRALVELGRRAAKELRMLETGVVIPRISECWALFEKSRRRKACAARTMKGYRQRWDVFEGWCSQGVTYLDDVTAGVAEQYVDYLDGGGSGKELTASTVNTHLQALRYVWRIVGPDLGCPFDHLSSRAKKVEGTYRPLEVAELRKLLAGCEDAEVRLLILIGYWTAQRLVDAALLRWEQIDIGRGVITFEPRKTSRLRKLVWVPLMPELAGELGEAGEGYVLPGLAEYYERSAPEVSRSVTRAMTRAKLEADAVGRVGYRSLRSTFVTRMDEAGAPAHVTDSVTGHDSGSMHRRYSKTDVETAREWMARALVDVAKGV